MINRYNKIVILIPEKKILAVENQTGDGKDDKVILETSIENLETISEDERWSELLKSFAENNPQFLTDIKAGQIGNKVVSVYWQCYVQTGLWESEWSGDNFIKKGFWANPCWNYGYLVQTWSEC